MVSPSWRCSALALVFASLLVQCQTATPPRPPADATTATTTATTTPMPTPTPRAPPSFDASSESAFTETAARLFRAESSRFSARILGPLALAVDVAGTKHHLRVSLDRLWAQCEDRPSDCEADLRDFVSKAVRTFTTREAPVSRDQVVALLRPRAYVDAIGGPSTSSAIVEPFVDDLYAVYVVDSPDATRSLTQADLDALKLSRDQLAPLARANLLQRLGDPGDAIGEAKAGDVVVLRMGDAFFQSSRLLLADGWAALSAKLAQPIVVAVPANDTMLVAIAPNSDLVETISQVTAKHFASAGRPVSPRLFRWNAGRWEVLQNVAP